MRRAVAGYGALAVALFAIAWVVMRANPGVVLIKGQTIHDTVAAICFLAFLFALAIGLGVGFAGRLRRGLLCTYQTIAYLTFCLFVAGSALVLTGQFVFLATSGTTYDITLLVGSIGWLSTFFIILSVPGVVIAALFLMVSNIVLVGREGMRPSNLLGFAVSIAAAVGFAIVFYLDWTLWEETSAAALSIRVIVPYVVNFFELLAMATATCALLAVRHEPPLDRDYVIILGCAIRPDGTPMRVLAGRIDCALAFARKQEAATGVFPMLVCSGGKGSDEVISEAESMANYLVGNGVPENRIIREDRSTNTRENMRFSRELIEADWCDRGAGEGGATGVAAKPRGAGIGTTAGGSERGSGSVERAFRVVEPEPVSFREAQRPKTAYVTTNYHVFRGGTFALMAGLEAEGLAARTAWYYWPNAFLREFVALVVTSADFVATALASIVIFALGIAATYHTLLP